MFYSLISVVRQPRTALQGIYLEDRYDTESIKSTDFITIIYSYYSHNTPARHS